MRWNAGPWLQRMGEDGLRCEDMPRQSDQRALASQ